MKILIDLQACQTASRSRGIGRYSLALAQAIARNCGSHDIHLLLNGELGDSIFEIRGSFSGLLPTRNIHVFEVPDFPSMDQNSWLFQAAHTIRQEFIETLAPDIVHVSSLMEWWDVPVSLPSLPSTLRSSLTLYDLIPLKRPDTLPPHPHAQQWYLSQVAQISQASQVLAISEYARQEALQALALDPSRVVTISAGVSEVFFRDLPDDSSASVNFFKSQGIEKPFALVVGVIEPRKNNLRLVEAWAQLSPQIRQSHQLVFVASTICPETFRMLTEAIRRHGIPDHEIIFLQDKSDEDLHVLYSACKVFILPSLHEGFGLPAAEAMVCGAATIGSNVTSIPEVIGWEQALFDPTSIEQIRDKLAQVLTDETFLLTLKQHAKSKAQQFSWDAVAQRAMAAFVNTEPVRKSLVSQYVEGDVYRDRLLRALAEIPFPADESNLCDAARAVAANRPRDHRQLLIDVSVLAISDSQTGIQRVVRNFSKQLLQNPPLGFQVRLVRCLKHRWVWKYATQLEQKILGQQTHPSHGQEPILEVFAGDVFLGADLGLEYVPNQRAWFDRARHKGVEIQFIVYDILPVRMPQYSHQTIVSLFVPWLQAIGEISSRLICISKTVADELGGWYLEKGFSPNQLPLITSIHMGADLDNVSNQTIQDPIVSQKLESLGLPTFLMVGTIEPRKGHQQVFDAFQLLWKQGIAVRLVIIGRVGWNVETLIKAIENHEQINKNLIWLNNSSDQVLEAWYHQASALIAASYGEGFGLPLIEAAHRKLPVLARDLAVFREVAGNHAFYFSAENPSELARAIQNWLQLFASKQHPRSDTMPWLSWKDSTDQLKVAMGIGVKQP